VLELCAAAGVPAWKIGVVGGNELVFRHGSRSFAWTMTELEEAWGGAIDRIMA
jgi:hypothetical protein